MTKRKKDLETPPASKRIRTILTRSQTSKIRRKNIREQIVPPRGGLTAPGTDFEGPFNPIDYAPPRSEGDALSKYHDIEYTNKNLKRPYLNWNNADAHMLEKLQQIETPTISDRLATQYWKLKRFASKIGLVGDETHIKRLKADPRENRKETPSVSNLLATTTMSDGQGSGNDGQLKETPLDDVWNVQRGPPEYQFATLPFIHERNVSTFNNASDFIYRMTSVYDCQATVISEDLNPDAVGTNLQQKGDTDIADVTAKPARWFDYYKGIYQYYSVVACRWNLIIENYNAEPIWVHIMYHNEESPPRGASNHDMLLWKDCNSYYVGEQSIGITNGGTQEVNQVVTNQDNSKDMPGTTSTQTTSNFESTNQITSDGKSHILKVTGQYRPGDYTREVKQDADVETWTLVTTNPKLSERLTIRVKNSSNIQRSSGAGTIERPLKYKLFFQAEYLVEFKDLDVKLRYPVREQPISVTLPIGFTE